MFKPLNRYVLVKFEEKTHSPGGIQLPTPTHNAIVSGEIIETGEPSYDIFGKLLPINVAVGDTVYFERAKAVRLDPYQNKFLLLYESLIGKEEPLKPITA